MTSESRLLACDQGSSVCGLAFFDDRTLIDLREQMLWVLERIYAERLG